MWRAALAVTITLMGTGAPASVKTDLTFLTRDGCVNTPDMVNNLDDALKALGWRTMMNPRVKTAIRLSILTLIASAILFYLPGF